MIPVYLINHIKRNPTTNAFFCLLLALSGALLCISAGLWYTANKALQDIDKTVTTIAMPNFFAIKQHAINDIKTNGITEYETENGMVKLEEVGEEAFLKQVVPRYEEEILKTIRDTVYQHDLLKKDRRRVFGAYAPAVSATYVRPIGLDLAPHIAASSAQSSAAFVVVCESSGVAHIIDWKEDANGLKTPFLTRHSYAVFSVEKPILLHPAYNIPKTINVIFNYRCSDEFPIIESGKRYVISGNINFVNVRCYMYIDNPSIGIQLNTGSMYSLEDIRKVFSAGAIDYYGLTENILPIEIIDYSFINQQVSDSSEYFIFEIEGSIEDALNTGRYEQMRKELEAAEISLNSLQVLTTNNANSLLRFNQNRNLLVSGRLFDAQESGKGARVCLISNQLAELNGLTVGDKLSLQMYASVLGKETVSVTLSDGVSVVSRNIWASSLYRPDLEITSPIEFEIIGILNVLSQDSGDYAISPNTVIIPDKSFEGVAGEPASRLDVPQHTPLLDDGVIIPNGQTEKAKAAIDGVVAGYSNLFRFYDQGYETLIRALSNLRFGLSWILTLAAAGWITVSFLFSVFYVARKRNETRILYAIGVSSPRRFRWVFVQSAALLLIALGIMLTVSIPLYSNILDLTAAAAEEFTVSFRDLTLSDAADVGIRRGLPLDKSVLALAVTAVTSSALLLFISGWLSARASSFGSLVSTTRE